MNVVIGIDPMVGGASEISNHVSVVGRKWEQSCVKVSLEPSFTGIHHNQNLGVDVCQGPTEREKRRKNDQLINVDA